MPKKLTPKQPKTEFDLLEVIIVIFHLCDRNTISNSTFRICEALNTLSKKRRFADLFKDCLFYHRVAGWYDEKTDNALWCMQMAGDLAEIIRTSGPDEYLFEPKLHHRGQAIVDGLAEPDQQRLQDLADGFIKLMETQPEGDKHA